MISIEQPTVLQKILEMLANNNIAYKRFDHDPVFTSEDAAKVRDTDISKGAKSLIMFADGKAIDVVVPGDCKLDNKEFKRLFSVKDLRMASKDEVQELTGLVVGSIPPLGSLFNMKTYFDESFSEKDYAYFNAGDHSVSIQMKASDLINLEKPVLGKFSLIKE